IARIARYTEILVITGNLPVGKRPLRWCRPHQRRRQQSEKKEKENAIAHGRYAPRSSNKQHKSYLRCAGSAAQSDLSD
ncbi:hypothetical protein ACP81S_18600, partial [Escherichia coli]